jgi:hypothetical protein
MAAKVRQSLVLGICTNTAEYSAVRIRNCAMTTRNGGAAVRARKYLLHREEMRLMSAEIRGVTLKRAGIWIAALTANARPASRHRNADAIRA